MHSQSAMISHHCCKDACYGLICSCHLSPGARFDDGAGGDNEVQRTMLELINQLDGFDPRGNIKVLMATNRPDTLDPALMRPGRLDRKIEFSLPDLEVRTSCLFISKQILGAEQKVRLLINVIVWKLHNIHESAMGLSMCKYTKIFHVTTNRFHPHRKNPGK